MTRRALTEPANSAHSQSDSATVFPGLEPELTEGSDVNPNDIDLVGTRAERIGHASSHERGKSRWTELNVYYLHEPQSPGRRWLSESVGRSDVPGERDRVRRLCVGSLDRALKLFVDTDIGVVASEEARDWAEARGAQSEQPIDRDAQHALMRTQGRTAVRRGPPQTDAEALEWLYGGKLDEAPRATFASMFAKDFDVAANTVTTALKAGTPIRLTLRSVLPFVDRNAFLAWRAGREKSDG